MAFTRITSTNIADGAVEPEKVSAAFEADYAKVANLSNYAAIAEIALGVAPKINVVSYANSTYSILDDTAANTGGGYLVITGTGFQSGAQVLIGTTPATSTTFVSSTELRAQVPAANAASYQLAVVNPDGGTGIKINGITYSGNPIWITSSALSNAINAVAFTGTFEANGATSYANTTALPDNFNLISANGYYYGNIEVESDTTYNFTVRASDDENQDSDRSFSFTVTNVVPPTSIEYIVVAGGGAAGGRGGGGGGAGGVRYGTLNITEGSSYTISVGAGGTTGGATSYIAYNGTDSSISNQTFILTSTGGGAGGSAYSSPRRPANSGGSGGGANYDQPSSYGSGNTPSVSPSQGNNGGSAVNSAPYYGAGGGGGATSVGGNGTSTSGGNGGSGLEWPTGSTVYYGGGGGGASGVAAAGGTQGLGGSGGGGTAAAIGNAGSTNTGGGGGGTANDAAGGTGGSGVVIIRYPDNKTLAVSTTGSPTYTLSGGYRYYKFTGTGSITW
jgi:hypothetical protein